MGGICPGGDRWGECTTGVQLSSCFDRQETGIGVGVVEGLDMVESASDVVRKDFQGSKMVRFGNDEDPGREESSLKDNLGMVIEGGCLEETVIPTTHVLILAEIIPSWLLLLSPSRHGGVSFCVWLL